MAGIRLTESGTVRGNYTIVNQSSGAYGAYQFLPKYWASWASLAGFPRTPPWPPDRATQDAVARGAFKSLVETYQGNWMLVAVAWHAGSGTVEKIRSIAGKPYSQISLQDIEAGHAGESEYVTSALSQIPGSVKNDPGPIQAGIDRQDTIGSDGGTGSGGLDDVRSIQTALNANGANLEVDGAFGPLTEAAVRAFQTDNGLTVDGIVGPQTSGALGISISGTVRRGGGGSGSGGGSGGGSSSTGNDPFSPQAVPNDSYLVQVGNTYRVLWDLPEGLGTVWYSITGEQLNQIYGEEWRDRITETFSNPGSFSNKYNDLYWGNVAEISQKAGDPWQDMLDRIFDQFGYVAGLNTPEIRRLVIQGYFEGWTTSEFISHYKDTEYFNSLSDIGREWATLSDAEKRTRIEQTAADLVTAYRYQWGVDPDEGINNDLIWTAAERIASGDLGMDVWEYHNRKAAEERGDTPANARINQAEIQGNEPEIAKENMGLMAEHEWRQWMGPVELPPGFAESWGERLYLGTNSEADLDNYLRTLSGHTFQSKPPDITWEDWAAGPKFTIGSLLESPTVENSDPLLQSILNKGLTGAELESEVRHDERFMGTNRAFQELSDHTTNIGQMFGFIGS